MSKAKGAYNVLANGSLFGPFRKLQRSLKERGWKGCLEQLYTVGDLKFGELKGTDKFGNRYYEDLELPYGQHRWVEYADIHNYDASMIQPEWHGWMHHMYDETPAPSAPEFETEKIAVASHARYKNHVGLANPIPTPQINESLLRQRGYKVGSLKTGPEDEDKYYKQPGHPLSGKKGRYPLQAEERK